MRPETPGYDRPPLAVSFALWVLWFALGISVAGYLFTLFSVPATATSGIPLPFLYLQIVVALVIYGFFATINVALGRRRNWARGSLFGMVLIETTIVVLVFLVAQWQIQHMGPESRLPVVLGYFAYALRVTGLALVMIPGRHWYRMQ